MVSFSYNIREYFNIITNYYNTVGGVVFIFRQLYIYIINDIQQFNYQRSETSIALHRQCLLDTLYYVNIFISHLKTLYYFIKINKKNI